MKTSFYFLLALVLLFASCSKEPDRRCTVNVQVVFPEGHTAQAFDEMAVTLTNKDQGTVYTSPCSASGLAFFEVEHGYYTASVQYQTTFGYQILVFNGRIESLPLLSEKGETAGTVELPLLCAESSALVIKEIYYGGCKGRLGEEYSKDQYVTLHNNSDKTLYLDGLCLGMVAPSSNAQSKWMKHTDMKRIPVLKMAWQFPGEGEDYPLLPGEETTIATNAVDHTGGEYQHANSVDLSKVDWGFWDQSIGNRQEITPGVKQMKLVWKISPLLLYALSEVGPTFMVFDLPGTTAEAYMENPDNREPEPTSSSKTKLFLMIPSEWILDCVECVESEVQVQNKRVPAILDNGAAYIPGEWYSGQSLVRKKIAAADGRAIYQDTNNSAQDLEVSVPTLKNK